MEIIDKKGNSHIYTENARDYKISKYYQEYLFALNNGLTKKCNEGYVRIAEYELEENNNLSRIFYSLDQEISDNPKNLQICLEDIFSSHQRLGIATNLFIYMLSHMYELENFYASKGYNVSFNCIHGELSEEDNRNGNWKSSINFYLSIQKNLNIRQFFDISFHLFDQNNKEVDLNILDIDDFIKNNKKATFYYEIATKQKD